jgi:cytoplasmic iron level regulating protein YaaA (DUF328/UPF0246 family)
MLILLSPSKTLDGAPSPLAAHTLPQALDRAQALIDHLRAMDAPQIAALMKVSDEIATLNVQRYQDFTTPFVINEGAKQALLAFKGDVYKDWPLGSYTEEDFAYAQRHLRILSGLYGALRPLDLIRPYRLEMGTRLRTDAGKDLYQFWGAQITEALAAALREQGDDVVINLASQEYFAAVRPEALPGRVIHPVFLDLRGGEYKLVALYAKKARGLMAHDLIQRRVATPEGLRAFTLGGYRYDEARSTPDKPTFVRDPKAA